MQGDFADLEHRRPTLAESQRMLVTMLSIIRESGLAIGRLVPPAGGYGIEKCSGDKA